MMTKTAYYMQMAPEAAAQITGSKEQWTAFLTTSARLYKYPFAEQLMIDKQRPEATACAEYDLSLIHILCVIQGLLGSESQLPICFSLKRCQIREAPGLV